MELSYFEKLHDGLSLVTPSGRLSSLIAGRYNTRMQAEGRLSWEAPRVMPFGAWVDDCFERLALSGRFEPKAGLLLSVDQERAVWEQVVRDHSDIEPEDVANLAGLAMNAWACSALWGLSLNDISRGGVRQEVRMFIDWAVSFQGRCNELDAIDKHRFAADLVDHGAHLGAVVPPFEFYGYVHLPSALVRITTSIGDSADATSLGHPNSSAAFGYHTFANRDFELNAVMDWAGQQKGAHTDQFVVVALADANRIDAKLAQRLERALKESASRHGVSDELTLVRSGTTSLADMPIVQSALLMLEWTTTRPWDEVSCLILTPYLGEAFSERDPRALLDIELRRFGDIEVSITSVIEAAKSGAVACPLLCARLESFVQAFEAKPARARLHDWIRFAETLLSALGWPGEIALNDNERAVMVEWRRAMDSLAELDAVQTPCDWHHALRQWRAILRSRLAPQPNDIGAVQLVTPEEAAYLDADQLWVAAFHDSAWPNLPDASPLLPYDLQREHGVPGTNPELDFAVAEKLLARLSERHSDAQWSYSLEEGETPRRPLVGHECRAWEADPPPVWSPPMEAQEFELIDDRHATRLDPNGSVSGGVALLTDQAACPFRAFARHRLHSQTPADATPGLNPMQRGNLIHAVLAIFWKQAKNSAWLQQVHADELEERIHDCVATVYANFHKRYRFIDSFWELERERLAELTEQWLREELKRGDFEVIACEQSRPAAIGSFIINTRVDRVDRLATGEVVIIDYKTGAVPRVSWQLPRPDQPQLPLYAVCAGGGEEVAGIAYAGLKKGECKFVDEPKGMGQTATSLEAAQQWSITKRDWHGALTALAEELEHGLAIANPKRGQTTCRYCDLQSLCRIHERPPNESLAGDDDD
ncbi:MAG: ATP-dependent helicase/nuclease subunit B [Gammaproteobacteria bacterium]|jgi:ATP-dependent helicase/nuclease subunit B